MTPQRSQNTSTALSQTSYVTFELLATHLPPTTDDLFSSFSFVRLFVDLIYLILSAHLPLNIEQYIDTSLATAAILVSFNYCDIFI